MAEWRCCRRRKARAAALRRAAIGEPVPGTRRGVTAEPTQDGLRAVTLLPPTAARQFQAPWDLSAGSRMNNGAVAAVMRRAEGHDPVLPIAGRDGPTGVNAATGPVRPVEAGREDRKPGLAVPVNAMQGGPSALVARRVTVERDGIRPPA